MKKILLALVVVGFSVQSYGQNGQVTDVSLDYAATITKDDLHDYLSILASDALEGRETGERGQKMAAAFIANHFREIGLEGPVAGGDNDGYFQKVTLYSSVPGDIFVAGKKAKFNNFDQVVYYGNATTDGEVETELVYAGAGTEADFEKLDVKDKAVIVWVDNTRAWRAPSELAKNKGAKLFMAINTPNDEAFNGLNEQLKHYLSGGRLSVEKPKATSEGSGVFFVKPSAAAEMLKTTTENLQQLAKGEGGKEVKPVSISYQVKMNVNEMHTENVLGYLEGGDLKDELVVLTAHYDHVGVNGEEVFNGADDDGSGTSAVMEIAQAFVTAKNEGNGPRRSMLFMLVTGEEKGLLGSEYYAANPVFPLENTIVDLNIDMIGRVDPEHKADSNYVYLVGSDRLSSELHQISEKVNETYTNFNLDYTYNDENHPDRIYYRSDHWNFAKNNVPIIFYFNGVHADYHQPSDTIDKIEFDLLRKRAQLVFHTAWVLSNRDQRPVVDKLQDQEISNN